MNPRIRTLVVLLILAFTAVPAQASAASACGADLPPYAAASLDATAPSPAWQTGVPAGTVDIPLLGGAGVDGWEYKVDCGAPVSIVGAGGTATVTGDGAHRFTHRAHDSVSNTWTDWVDHFVLIDSTFPANTTTPPTTNWLRGPVNLALTASDAVSPVHTEWRVDGAPSWTTGNSATISGTGVHQLESAAVDAAGNRTERSDTVKVDNTLPVDTTVTPAGWQDGAVEVTVTGSDADAGVDHVEWQLDAQAPASGPEGTVVAVSGQGAHTLRTRVVDEVGNASAWLDHTVQVDIQGPADTTTLPSGWITDPSAVIEITADDNGGSGIKRIQWRLDGQTTGDVVGTDRTPVTVSGDGVHELEVRLTDNQDRVNDWHTHLIRIDTVDPVDTTAVASGWLPLAYLDVIVRGTDQHSLVQGVEWRLDGGDVMTASENAHEVRVAGNGVHTLQTRIVDNAGRRSGWRAHTIRLDSTVPTNTTPAAPAGWRNTPYSVVLNGSDAGSGVASVSWKVRLEGEAESDVREGARGVETASIDQDGTHTLSTRVSDAAGSDSNWRVETIRIDRVLPTDGTTYPSAPVGNRHVVTFSPQDDRSGAAGVEWTLDGGGVQTAATATITGAGTHTLSVRVRDNAGNWSAWANHSITVVLGLDTTAPADTTVVPTSWQLVAHTVTVSATDDVDGTGVAYVQWRYGDHPAGQGPSGTEVRISADGEHEIETRAVDRAGNASPWRRQTLRLDTTQPIETTVLPSGWTKANTFTLRATDATSGVANLEYKIGNAAPVVAANGTTVTLPGDGDYRISHRALDNAGQSSAWKVDEFSVDTVSPVNTSAAAPTAWQTSALELALTGTDAGSGVDRAEWRVAGGTIRTGSATAVTTEGSQTLETRIVDKAGNASNWRSESIRIDRTKPVNTTPAPTAPWQRTNYTTTVTGSDATPGSGVARVEYKVDGGSVVSTPAVSITAEGPHTLSTRVVDTAGNASDWREDAIGIDKTVPTLAVDCGPSSWRNTPATCEVVAGGGLSGLPTLTAARDSGPAEPTGGRYSVEADGASILSFRAVDGAGNETTAQAEVRIDRTAPAAGVGCTPGGGTSWSCTGTGSDPLSGVTSLTYSVDGSAPAAVGAGGSFTVQKGNVVVYATDAAGNTGASSALTLADRTPPAPKHEQTDAQPTPRTTTEAVLLRKAGTASARLLGQLELASTPARTTVDLRPLALGKGTFQLVIKLRTGKRTKTVTRTQTTRNGYSSRIRFGAGAGSPAAVTLTVRKKSGRRWIAHATAATTLK